MFQQVPCDGGGSPLWRSAGTPGTPELSTRRARSWSGCLLSQAVPDGAAPRPALLGTRGPPQAEGTGHAQVEGDRRLPSDATGRLRGAPASGWLMGARVRLGCRGGRARGEGQQVIEEVHEKAIFVMSNGTSNCEVPAPGKDGGRAQGRARARGAGSDLRRTLAMCPVFAAAGVPLPVPFKV